VKGLHRRGVKDPSDLAEAIVLGNLESVDEALLLAACVPDLGPVCEYRDNQGIVDLAPVEEVEAADQIAEDADAPDGRVGMVGHDFDMWFPVEVTVDEHPQEAEGVSGSDALGP